MHVFKILLASSAIGFLAACSNTPVLSESGEDMTGQAGVYTLVNLHPDETRQRLYATNYQMPSLIPLCTEVVILEASNKKMEFQVKDTGRTYQYYYHRSAVEPMADHLKHFFGKTCNKEAAAKLSSIDQQGIEEGRIYEGMSKKGVVLALGIPPKHVTPNLDSNRWQYWKNRYDTMMVEFDKSGKVSKIVD